MFAPKKPKYLIKLTLVTKLGGLLFEYDTGAVSGTVGSLESFFVIPKSLSETTVNAFKGFLKSSAPIGCIIEGIISELLSQKSGRKKGLVINQIREEYLCCLQGNYSENEFKHLIRKGFNVKNMHYNYVPTRARGSPIFIVLLLAIDLILS
ncbi:MAG: MFS transporter [Algibacter sp.]